MMVSFYEPPVVYPAAHRIHAAFLARQVPTNGRRKTVAKTDALFRTSPTKAPLGAFFLRAEVHSRRPANCGAVRPIHRIVDNVAISLYNINTYSYSMRLAEKGDFIDEF